MNTGDKIATDYCADELTIVQELTPNAPNTDSAIRVYECSAPDGMHQLIASDNASNWVVGDPDDNAHNYVQFYAIEEANGNTVNYAYINDAALSVYIADRYAAYRNMTTIADELTGGRIPVDACLRWNTREDMTLESGLHPNTYKYEIANVMNDGAHGWGIETPYTRADVEAALDYIAANTEPADHTKEQGK